MPDDWQKFESERHRHAAKYTSRTQVHNGQQVSVVGIRDDKRKGANHGRPDNDAPMEDKMFVACGTRAASPVPTALRLRTCEGLRPVQCVFFMGNNMIFRTQYNIFY